MTGTARWDAWKAKRKGGRQADVVVHECHARECRMEVDPSMLMCPHHWRMVPAPLQRVVWAEYRPGQEVSKTPSPAYLRAAQDAIAAVWEIEKRRRLDKLDHGRQLGLGL